MVRIFIVLSIFPFLFACNTDEKLAEGVVWRTPLNQKSLIYDLGIGYPIYKNTVVFHSTPVPNDPIHESILHGLNTETGKEKWRLTNKDFYPKKNLEFFTFDYLYQRDNIVVGCDWKNGLASSECYAYAIDIDAGKVLWVKPIPTAYQKVGIGVKGSGKYAYIDTTNENKFTLLKVDIQTGEISVAFEVGIADLPVHIQLRNPIFYHCFLSNIYKNKNDDELIACCINTAIMPENSPFLMTLYIYNLSKMEKVYSIPATIDTLHDKDNGKVSYHNGKLFVGKGAGVFCFDAFEDKGVCWKHFLGSEGNDNITQVFTTGDLALGYTVDKLFAFDLNSGKEIYSVVANDNTASIIDGIIYQREGSDLGMRDSNTGKLLKRIATGRDEQAFSSSRPNGADGKIFVHSYTHAYCIKAWGR